MLNNYQSLVMKLFYSCTYLSEIPKTFYEKIKYAMGGIINIHCSAYFLTTTY